MTKQRRNPRPILKAGYFRVQMTMPRKMNDWLEQLGSDSKEHGGHKLTKCQIVRSLVSALQAVRVKMDMREIKSEETLTERILEAFKRK